MSLPHVGEQLPRRGNTLLPSFGRAVLDAFGWRVAGALPDRRKFVIVVAPHTSNWDFVFGAATMLALDLEIYWIGKHTLFREPFGRFMRWLGGVPVDRSSPKGLVEQIVDAFQRRDQMVLAITPEGTRKQVRHWKTGFHRIARGANVPIVPVFLDYERRVVGIGPAFETTENTEDDVKAIRVFYENIRGRNVRGF